jgi:hypothetical protein
MKQHSLLSGTHGISDTCALATTFKYSKRKNRYVETRMSRRYLLSHRAPSTAPMSQFECAHWHSGTAGMQLARCARTDGA